jgi:hypothetical protein
MSISVKYRPEKTVRLAEFIDALTPLGVREDRNDYYIRDTQTCLSDSDGRQVLVRHDAGVVVTVLDRRTFGISTTVAPIIKAIKNVFRDVFRTRLFSEYEPQFYGFESKEEEDAAWEADVVVETERLGTAHPDWSPGKIRYEAERSCGLFAPPWDVIAFETERLRMENPDWDAERAQREAFHVCPMEVYDRVILTKFRGALEEPAVAAVGGGTGGEPAIQEAEAGGGN